MKKRDGTKQTNPETTTSDASGSTTADAIEQRLVTFAEQLGRMVGTIQAKTEGWLDRETLHTQIASVRDGAANLLEQLADATKATKTPAAAASPDAAPRGGSKGRSGGTVDAPGKRHRKPARNARVANLAHSQADKLRTAKTMTKTHRRRGRG
jgi:hypothetical protein